MPVRERSVDRGVRRAVTDLTRVGSELRVARTAAGIPMSAVSGATGISSSQISRIERGHVPTASVSQLARIGAVVGLDVRVRTYPGPDPLRDAGQVRLIGRLRTHLHPSLVVRLEVPLPIAGDPRAWDAWVGGFVDERPDHRGMPVEAEARFSDAQAQIRQIMLKMRDADVNSVLLVLSETPANRAAVAAASPILTGSFPVSARRALAALGAGRHPGGSALVFI